MRSGREPAKALKVSSSGKLISLVSDNSATKYVRANSKHKGEVLDEKLSTFENKHNKKSDDCGKGHVGCKKILSHHDRRNEHDTGNRRFDKQARPLCFFPHNPGM